MSSTFVHESRKVREVGASLLRQMALEKQLVAQRLGQQIARHRARLRLTQEEAAAKVGVTHRAYQRWESGESMPYPRNIERIAEAFEVEVDELLSEAATPSVNGNTQAQLDRIEAGLTEILRRFDLLDAKLAANDLAQRKRPGHRQPPEAADEATGQ